MFSFTGDQLAIGKEMGRRLGMGTNMYPSSALLGKNGNEVSSSLPIDELIEKADGFAGVFPEHKYEIVKRLQDLKHICGMTGDGVNDAPALKKADIGIVVSDSTDDARSASDIKSYIRCLYHHSYCGTIMTISKDRVKPSPLPDSWKLKEIFATGVFLGSYMALMTAIFFWAAYETNFFPKHFHVKNFNQHEYNMSNKEEAKVLNEMMASAVYLQISTISQALIFVTRARGWSFMERPGLLLVFAFILAQLVATLISATISWDTAEIQKIGWGWTGVIWLYKIVTYMLLDPLKFAAAEIFIPHFVPASTPCFTECVWRVF